MPSKVRLEVIKPPKDFLTSMNLGGVAQAAIVETARNVRSDFEKTTRTWRTPVKFTIRRKNSANEFGIEVSTDNQIYRWVSDGTEPHLIAPRYKKALAFNSKFRPKTRVRYIGSFKGFSGGKKIVRRTVVHHPGTEGRHFEEVIQEKWQPRIVKLVQDRINKAVAKKSK